jgi:hypothetical protein
VVAEALNRQNQTGRYWCHLRDMGGASRSHSRFRGNDRRFERDPTPNETATDGRQLRWVAVRSMLSVGVKWIMEIPVE